MPIHKNFIAKSIAVVFLIAALAVVRKLENMLFYDPFLSFFHLNNANAVFPDFNTMQLLCSYAGRYLLNTIISLLILYVVFNDFELIKFASLIYVILLVLLIIMCYIVLVICVNNNQMLLFYVRRFLIQPLFLLLFLAGFYFQKNSQ